MLMIQIMFRFTMVQPAGLLLLAATVDMTCHPLSSQTQTRCESILGPIHAMVAKDSRPTMRSYKRVTVSRSFNDCFF